MKGFILIASLICVSTLSILAQATEGQAYRFNFSDVDGNAFSTADGHVTVLIVSSKDNIDKARLIGERVPDFCLANPTYRMVTIVEFESKHSAPVRLVLKSVIRHRLDSEAQRLQARYQEHQITRDARRDVFAVADFDHAVATQLGLKPDPVLFRVFVFGKDGELLKQWNDVPASEELAAALK